MAILEVHNIEKAFGSTKVLKGVSFDLEEGNVLSIIGSSGSGKTTLLRCINFLETADKGKITVDGDVIFDSESKETLTSKQKREKQLKIGLVFQQFNLFPQYNVLDNVTLAMKLQAKERPDFKKNKKKIYAEIEQKALSILGKMGLSDKIKNYPCELSGGQQQRVAIARALMNEPPVLFADEPTGNLDTKSSIEIMNLFTELSNEGITIVMVTHEDDIAAYAKRHIVMRDGKVMTDDKADGGKRKTTEEVAELVRKALA